MKIRVALIALTLVFSGLSLGGCVAPRFCPPGTHPGPYGQRCFLNG